MTNAQQNWRPIVNQLTTLIQPFLITDNLMDETVNLSDYLLLTKIAKKS